MCLILKPWIDPPCDARRNEQTWGVRPKVHVPWLLFVIVVTLSRSDHKSQICSLISIRYFLPNNASIVAIRPGSMAHIGFDKTSKTFACYSACFVFWLWLIWFKVVINIVRVFSLVALDLWGSNPRFWHCFVDEDSMAWCKRDPDQHFDICFQCFLLWEPTPTPMFLAKSCALVSQSWWAFAKVSTYKRMLCIGRGGLCAADACGF